MSMKFLENPLPQLSSQLHKPAHLTLRFLWVLVSDCYKSEIGRWWHCLQSALSVIWMIGRNLQTNSLVKKTGLQPFCFDIRNLALILWIFSCKTLHRILHRFSPSFLHRCDQNEIFFNWVMKQGSIRLSNTTICSAGIYARKVKLWTKSLKV